MCYDFEAYATGLYYNFRYVACRSSLIDNTLLLKSGGGSTPVHKGYWPLQSPNTGNDTSILISVKNVCKNF